MEFQAWPKTPRLFRTITVTEKIDGTNAAIIIERIQPGTEVKDPALYPIVEAGETLVPYYIGAQSRNRLIFPGKDTDNFGFAGWVRDNAAELVTLLGEGRHFGEWWGQGVARKYDMDHKQFSLFNTDKWEKLANNTAFPVEYSLPLEGGHLGAVPVLYQGEFSERSIQECLYDLQTLGSVASPGFKNPEGIVVFHNMARQTFKVTLDGEDRGKWEVNA